ncbi:type IV pilus biogenesis/stability protein PilW [Pelomonas sp. KK5]|uniref:type IV pilus biogenesis/stability protein PilW n=1 Tax=Pelomonas sp. KK5 TaxID=1855730 RepID=UPI0009FB11DB|nr:type IV pilus biogenesis/stability protein PilW [Pelomonas sp. KK5]
MTRARPAPDQQYRFLKSGLLPVLATVLLGLAGCQATAPVDNAVPKTESDTTNAERRANVRTELAKGYFTQGQYNTALDEIKQALAAKPDARDAINLRGLVYAAMGEKQLADDSFKRALVTFPRDPDIMHNYGWFLCQERRYPAAFEQFNQALQQPEYRGMARTLLARGVCELSAGKTAEAQASLAKAFEYDPGNPAIAYNLASVLYRGQQYERARFYIRRVNAQAEQTNAQSLWLELRIERRMGNAIQVGDLSKKLRREYAQSPETQAMESGQFDE